jgi:Zn-dependent peptidase ImmA (M78 family)
MARRKPIELTAQEMEEEANLFAIELLMPAFMLERDLAGKALDVESDKLVDELAGRYKVSKQLMVMRLAMLGYFGELED